MNYMKMLGLAALAATALTSFAASSASATTGEVGGVTKNETIKITTSLKAETSGVMSRTDGSFINTCAAGGGTGSSSTFTGTAGLGSISEGSASECVRTGIVHKYGSVRVEHVAGTTDGTVYSQEGQVTVGSPFGTLNCTSGAGTHVGTLTGKSSGQAELHVNSVVNCGFLVPSAKVQATVIVTSPEGLGVSA